jgi:acetyltransferase
MSVLNLMANEGLGLNKFVSVGNILDITAEDMLEYLIEDPGTAMIFVYLESIRDGRRLMEVARNSPKPVLIFKSNIGKLGNKIALSHTASLTSDDKVVDAAFHQAGVLRIRDATTLGNTLKILRLPPMRGKNLAVISRSGGHAVLAADACELSGFSLAQFPEEFLREIEKHFRASVIRLTNPLDLGDLFDLDLYADIVEHTLQLPGVDGVVFLHTSLSEAENHISRLLLERLMEMSYRHDKPVAYYLSTAASEVTTLKQMYNFPVFTQVVETVRALEMSHYYYRQSQVIRTAQPVAANLQVNPPAVREIITPSIQGGRNLLLSEALAVLEAYGIPTVRGQVAQTSLEAVQAAQTIGFPVAIKVISEQISHKSDVGGVQLNLRNAEAVVMAFDDMLARIRQAYPHAILDGVLVQPMVTGGRELILGGRQDPQFGPVVVIGLGGIFVEVFEESVVRVAPISQQDAEEMVNRLRGVQILKGARGDRASDIPALVNALLRVSQLLCDFPEIKELDINPLRVFYEGEGCRALDARMILAKNQTTRTG